MAVERWKEWIFQNMVHTLKEFTVEYRDRHSPSYCVTTWQVLQRDFIVGSLGKSRAHTHKSRKNECISSVQV